MCFEAFLKATLSLNLSLGNALKPHHNVDSFCVKRILTRFRRSLLTTHITPEISPLVTFTCIVLSASLLGSRGSGVQDEQILVGSVRWRQKSLRDGI